MQDVRFSMPFICIYAEMINDENNLIVDRIAFIAFINIDEPC